MYTHILYIYMIYEVAIENKFTISLEEGNFEQNIFCSCTVHINGQFTMNKNLK